MFDITLKIYKTPNIHVVVFVKFFISLCFYNLHKDITNIILTNYFIIPLNIEYKVVKDLNNGNNKLYSVNLFIENKLSGSGQDYTIKKAEQNAAENFLKNKEKTEFNFHSETDQNNNL